MDLNKFNLGVRSLRHSHVCVGCNEQFMSNRKDAVCCSPRCRKRYQRKCDAIAAGATVSAKSIGMGDASRADPGKQVTKHGNSSSRRNRDKATALKKKGRPARSKNAKKGRKKK